jgi:hydrogenase maturation protease
MKVAILGIGNILASDDGVGIRVIRKVRNDIVDDRIVCFECERGGLDLLDLLANAEKSIVVDAARTGGREPGTVSSFVIRKPFSMPGLPSLHTMGLDAVLAFGTATGMRMPDEVIVYTVEAADIETFAGGCTPQVENAIPTVVAHVKDQIREFLLETQPAISSHTGPFS